MPVQPAARLSDGRRAHSQVRPVRWRSEADATRIAASTGQFFAILMGLAGLLGGNFLLVFVAMFVYLGAMQEGAAAAAGC